jgi:MFS transporter, FHS family, glucose/mannose:H+ symporter
MSGSGSRFSQTVRSRYHNGVQRTPDKTSQTTATAVANLVYGMIASLAGTIVPQLSTRLGLTPEQIGSVFLAQAAGMIIASVSAGPLVDHRGKKTGVCLALVVIVAALLALPASHSGGVILLAMVLLGLGNGTLVTSLNAIASDIDPKKRATILAFVKCFYGLGGFATPFLGASLLKGNTITLCYVIVALTLATLALMWWIAIPPPSVTRGFRLAEVRAVASRPILYLFSLTVFLYVSCEVGTFNWMAKHLIAQGMPEASALRVVALGFSVGLIVGRLAFAGMLLRIRAITATLVGAAGMAVTTYAILQVHGVLETGILAFLAALSMAPIFPATLAMTGDNFPRMTASAMGVVITSGWLGLAVSSRLIGAIAGADPRNIRTGLLVLPVFSVLMVIVNLVIRRMMASSLRVLPAMVSGSRTI